MVSTSRAILILFNGWLTTTNVSDIIGQDVDMVIVFGRSGNTTEEARLGEMILLLFTPRSTLRALITLLELPFQLTFHTGFRRRPLRRADIRSRYLGAAQGSIHDSCRLR